MALLSEPPPPAPSPDDQQLVEAFAELLAADHLASEPGAWLAERLGMIDRIRARLDAKQLDVVAAWSSSMDWAVAGYRSAKSWLVGHTDVSAAQASAWLRTSTALASMPHTSAAAALGRMGFAKISLLAAARTRDTAEAFDRDEESLVEIVAGLSVDGTRQFLHAWKLRVCPDTETDLNDPDRDRLHVSTTFGGRGVADGEFCPQNTAILLGALDAKVDAWHRAGALDGDTRTRSQLYAAALIELVSAGSGRQTQHRDLRPLVLMGVDHRTLAKLPVDSPEDAATRYAEIYAPGSDPLPVPVETIHRNMCNGDVCRVVHNGRSMPLDVGRRERLATADQRRALIAIAHGVCEWSGCATPAAWCDTHHPHIWDADGETNIDNLVLLCNGHHHLVHEGHFHVTRSPDGIEIRDPHGQLVPPPPNQPRPD
ncbi:MAG: hypothetical protein JWM89_3634 [Acidimicrobiales bacterium]|nr:hypothetical protein [Acidimicrobiales bacterium]